MIKNPPWSYKDEMFYILNKPYTDYNMISNGDWYIKGSLVTPIMTYGEALFLMEGWIIRDYKVREDQEVCGVNEFIFVDRITKEEYEFDPELFGISGSSRDRNASYVRETVSEYNTLKNTILLYLKKSGYDDVKDLYVDKVIAHGIEVVWYRSSGDRSTKCIQTSEIIKLLND